MLLTCAPLARSIRPRTPLFVNGRSQQKRVISGRLTMPMTRDNRARKMRRSSHASPAATGARLAQPTPCSVQSRSWRSTPPVARGAAGNAEPGTRNLQPLRRSRRPGARRGHSTSSHPCCAWRRHRRSARAADPASDAERRREVSPESVAETHSDISSGSLRPAADPRVLASLGAAARRHITLLSGLLILGPAVIPDRTSPVRRADQVRCVNVRRGAQPAR